MLHSSVCRVTIAASILLFVHVSHTGVSHQDAYSDSSPCDPVNSMFLYLCNNSHYTRALSVILSNSLNCSYSRRSVPSMATGRQHVLMLLLLCGDVQLNPGPKPCSVYPCGYCELNVTWSQRAICCDNCSIWYHKSCHEMPSSLYANIENEHWVCGKCASTNVSSFTFHAYELDSRDGIVQEDSSTTSIPSPTTFNPQLHSSPKLGCGARSSTSNTNSSARSSHWNCNSSFNNQSDNNFTADPVPAKSRNLRMLTLNANSIAGKAAEFATLVDYIKPDVIIMTETKLGLNTHFSAEFTPPGFSAPKRKDRKAGGGGVLICVRDCYTAAEVEVPDGAAEVVWVEISLRNNHKLYVASFYRPPNGDAAAQLDALGETLHHIGRKIKNNPNHTVMLGGDFNLGDINWDTETIDPSSQRKSDCDRLIQLLRDHQLSQMQREATREGRVLDLYCTNKPSLVKAVTTVPGISDHDAVVADCDVKPAFAKKKPRTIFLFSKANWANMKSDATKFALEFLGKCAELSVEENWRSLKAHITLSMTTHIPFKTTSKRQNLPWLTGDLRRRSKRKHRMYNKCKVSKEQNAMANFKKYKKETAREQKRARWKFVNNIVNKALEENNSRPFWSYVKAQRQDNFGIPPLKKDGKLHADSKTKARIMLDEFTSVFTREDTSSIPTLDGTPYPSIGDLQIHQDGVTKLLKDLNPNKAAGPDNIPCRVLKELAEELSPVITAICCQSLESGILPVDWTEAIISPIYKKGNVHLALNYRPVSLTSVISKTMEHIICKHILNHLDTYHILSVFQHGFRKTHSCESQLLITVNDFLHSYDKKIQTDAAILDFSRAFDTVPHERLLRKLDHYGITGNVKTWIRSFLCHRQMRVAVDGEFSPKANVASGVPQGTVLGPLLFLLFINDLPLQVSLGTAVRLFADDCLVYREVGTAEDQAILQKDLAALESWSTKWGMRFNPSKCDTMTIDRSRSSLSRQYSLCGVTLKEVEQAKYLGIIINNKLQWGSHVDSVAGRASNTLNFLRRNLKYCPKQAKQTAYFSLVRSAMEYGAAVWDPYLQKDKDKLEKVNRRAARFVANNYEQCSSVTTILKKLGWQSLEHRRQNQRLTMMYKIVHNLVAVPTTLLIPADSRTRMQHQYKYRAMSTSTSQHKNSFFPRTIPQWNILNQDIADSPSLDAFKNRLL